MSNKRLAQDNDNRIMEIAFYHESRGQTVPVANAKNVYDRFSEFKRYIKRGSFSIKELEETVYTQHGILTEYQNTIEKQNNVNAFLASLDQLTKVIKGQKNGEIESKEKEEEKGEGRS